MNSYIKSKLATKYIFFELLPSFVVGIIVFIFVLLMFQILRLTEFVLMHGVDLWQVLKMMSFMTVSFIPVIFPMSILFSVLLTYGRLSSDSEVIAFKALGLNFMHLSLPAIILAAVTTIMSLQVSSTLAPWGNRAFEIVINNLQNMKASITIKPGVFSEGFYDMVVYANDVDNDTGVLKKIFIYDERNAASPLTIIAKEGLVLSDKSSQNVKTQLRLKDGNIHRSNKESYTKIDFDTFDINLYDDSTLQEAKKSPLSYSSKEIRSLINQDKFGNKHDKLKFQTEYHRRISLAFACLFFTFAGLLFGIQTNKRAAKANGVVLSIGFIVFYWILYVACETMAKNGALPPYIAVWLPNFAFLCIGLTQYKKILT